MTNSLSEVLEKMDENYYYPISTTVVRIYFAIIWILFIYLFFFDIKKL